jgi:hypothetical protein
MAAVVVLVVGVTASYDVHRAREREGIAPIGGHDFERGGVPAGAQVADHGAVLVGLWRQHVARDREAAPADRAVGPARVS